MNELGTHNLMSIGAFAKRARLSYKALRLYDAVGLLPPAWVDEGSNYRYYGEEQLEKAKLIGLLRQLEMPLNHIAQVLDLDGNAASQAVARYWQEVEADVRTKRKLVHYLETYLGGKGDHMFEIATRNVPEQKVLSVQRSVYAKDLPEFIGSAVGKLYRTLAEAGLEAGDTSFVAYHGEVNEDSDGPVEACVPFSGSLEPKDDLCIRLEPAHQEAYTRLTKAQVAFPGILEAYDAVHQYLQDQGKAPSGSPREVYFAAWDAIGDDDPACDIAFPYGA